MVLEKELLMYLNKLKNLAFFKLMCQQPPCRSPIPQQAPSTDLLPLAAYHFPILRRSPILSTLAVLLLTALVLVAVSSNTGHADTKKLEAKEYQIKAAYLYNFILFTRWPMLMTGEGSGPDSDTVIIGIVGKDPFGTFFSEVEGRTIKMGDVKKKLIIKRFGAYNNTPDLTSCHLLFVSASEKSHLDQILAKVWGAPVLTVGDMDNFINSGGMIRLVKVKDKIRWEISRGPVASAELRLDAMLLKSAVRVIGNQ